ncbi:MAG: sugar phosphate nucleotidyltransferase [Planctomycetia bacterium]|nr:sugar phosphate nucleotidyltransferase [Planctomycetia bacterium]
MPRIKKEKELPPLMILCGGKGTRLRDVSEILPKPMVPIGDQPIIWHIMRSYAAFGVKRFILCLGYKKEEFIDYFVNFRARATDITIQLGSESHITYHGSFPEEDWEITLANTGEETKTGGRIFQASRHLKKQDQNFFLTYGDGVGDVHIGDLLKFHRKTGLLLTLSAVYPEGRFGELVYKDGLVDGFAEKPIRTKGRINGGFMVMNRDFISRYLDLPYDTFLEAEPFDRAINDRQVAAYPHDGYWQCMDTPREHQLLNELWKQGDAPWTKYW